MRPGWLSLLEGRIETAWWGPDPSEAPTIVLLHEGLGCVALWRDVPERLASMTGLGVFAYSRFSYGQSDLVTLPRPMTYMHHEGQVVLAQVMAAAGVRDAVLVGHSDGGSIAAIYAGMVGAKRIPLMTGGADRVLPVMVGAGRPSTPSALSAPQAVDGGANPDHDEKGPGNRGRDERGRGDSVLDVRAVGEPKPHLHALITIAAHFFVEDLNIASIRQIKDTYDTGDLRQRLARYHRDPDNAFYGWNGAWLDPRFRGFDITGFLPAIHVPTLGLQGADDPYGTEAQLRVMQTHVSAPLEIRLIPGARHSPHLEAKDATLGAITRFIAATVGQPVP